MSPSQLAARKSLGVGLTSIGTVFLLVAALLVVFEGAGGATAAANGGGSTGLNQIDDWCADGGGEVRTDR